MPLPRLEFYPGFTIHTLLDALCSSIKLLKLVEDELFYDVGGLLPSDEPGLFVWLFHFLHVWVMMEIKEDSLIFRGLNTGSMRSESFLLVGSLFSEGEVLLSAGFLLGFDLFCLNFL